MSEIPRRRRAITPGKNYTVAEARIALLVYNTYVAERTRHTNQRRTTQHAHQPRAFADQLGDMPADRRLRNTENVEDGAAEDQSVRVAARGEGLWIKLAKSLIVKQYDPVQFVHAQFAVLPPGASAPLPESLVGPKAVANYNTARQVSYQQLLIAFKCQKLTCEREIVKVQTSHPRMTKEEAWKDVLLDTDLALSALFRYCLAASIIRADPRSAEAFEPLLDLYRIPAVLQYVYEQDNYNDLWREWIPPGFGDTAARVYDQYYTDGSDGQEF